MTLGRYALVVSTTVGISLGLLLPTLLRGLDARARLAALTGGLLAATNTVLAYALVLWSKKRSTTVFLGAVLGGMVGRMAALLLAVTAAILFWGLPKVPLAVSLLSYFVLFLILELAQIQRETSERAR
ncbi:MAG TPA: hypothetical protein VN083_01015 [Vicinamibacteria bacterium]|nr:hypothetical protein [Vicinamibacteria bacterium]